MQNTNKTKKQKDTMTIIFMKLNMLKIPSRKTDNN